MIFVFLTWAVFKAAICAALFWLGWQGFIGISRIESKSVTAWIAFGISCALIALSFITAHWAIEIMEARLGFSVYGLK